MSDDELKIRQTAPYRIWGSHGSWVILALVGVFCFMGGSSFNAWLASGTVKTISASYERQSDKQVARIRELNAEVSRLNAKLLPEARKAVREAAKAVEAVEKAVGNQSSQPSVNVQQMVSPGGNQ